MCSRFRARRTDATGIAATQNPAVSRVDWPMIAITAVFAALALFALWAAFGYY